MSASSPRKLGEIAKAGFTPNEAAPGNQQCPDPYACKLSSSRGGRVCRHVASAEECEAIGSIGNGQASRYRAFGNDRHRASRHRPGRGEPSWYFEFRLTMRGIAVQEGRPLRLLQSLLKMGMPISARGDREW